MCLIIQKPAGQVVCPDLVSYHVSRNPDGFGFLDLSTGQLTRTMSAKKIRKMCKRKAPFVAHFRYATQGDVNRSNVHPFESGRYLVFMNGTITSLRNPDGLCDTDVIAQSLEFIKPDCIESYLSIFDVRFLVFDTVTGDVIRTGDWHNVDGVHYSKDPKPTKFRASHWSINSQGYIDPTWPESSYMIDHESDFDLWAPEGPTTLDLYDEMTAGPDKHLVAVYGTLKQGGGNHRLLNTSEYLGEVVSEDKLRLVCDGLPFVIRGADDRGSHLRMELYEVDHQTLSRLDHLEGHPNFYRRERVQFWTLDQLTEHIVNPWIYMVDESYDSGFYSSEWVTGLYR